MKHMDLIAPGYKMTIKKVYIPVRQLGFSKLVIVKTWDNGGIK